MYLHRHLANMSLRFKILTSGSKGNATLIACDQGLRTHYLLLDCGLPQRRLCAYLQAAGIKASQLDAIFITHEHDDHIGCAHAFALRYHIPIYMSSGTHTALNTPELGNLLHFVRDGDLLDIAGMEIQPFTVPHDAREPLQLRCSNGNRILAIATDLGYASNHVLQHLKGCHALILEANHDPDMLEESSYPDFLKRRIAGAYGHLSNVQAAHALKQIHHAGLGYIVAAHLSASNNCPELAQKTLAQAIGYSPTDILVAQVTSPSAWLSV